MKLELSGRTVLVKGDITITGHYEISEMKDYEELLKIFRAMEEALSPYVKKN